TQYNASAPPIPPNTAQSVPKDLSSFPVPSSSPPVSSPGCPSVPSLSAMSPVCPV
ncbi:unnamed protein product, partial [Coccothraustes coccothraustes]